MSPNQNQKIAAFGSSYREMRSSVGAAEGCDLLILAYLVGLTVTGALPAFICSSNGAH
ncbi:hypothetical protein PS718_01898 [Pseudomonas fluorescens]|uniref:Uncharacterized protein n=1 Tax=Pseudomonas fluorescens TaxID=294 RepID=A0A5E7BNG0_PSEFL|nr:hypothetical protein PS718_01898 [Pseudomonas fluorescens]